jgi:hypothetical protein
LDYPIVGVHILLYSPANNLGNSLDTLVASRALVCRFLRGEQLLLAFRLGLWDLFADLEETPGLRSFVTTRLIMMGAPVLDALGVVSIVIAERLLVEAWAWERSGDGVLDMDSRGL